ncbi:MAG: TolC family protein [Blastocatellia bacterium]
MKSPISPIFQRLCLAVMVSGLIPVAANSQTANGSQSATVSQPVIGSPETTALVESVRSALRLRLGYPPLPYATNDDGSTPQTLTLEEVINAIDLYHPKLRGADVSRRIASAKRLEKQGAFDPVIFAGYDYLRFNTEFDPKTLRGKSGSSNLTDAGVEFLTRSGVKIGGGARYNIGKIKAPLSPTGDGGEYFLSFKVPLLRGFRINEKAAAERQAFLGEPLAETDYQLTRLELLRKAADSYWDWVASKRKFDVARDLLGLAEFRARAVRDRVGAGDLPEIDSVEADLEVQRRQGGLVKADRDLQKSAFKLSIYLWSPNGLPSPIPQPTHVPATTPPPIVYSEEQSAFGQRIALDRRPEMKALAINNDITQIDLELARNQKLPELDLAFMPGRDTGFGSIGTTVKAGASFSLPVRQRAAEGRIAQAGLKLQKLALDVAGERQRITTEVLDAISAINTASIRYGAAQSEVELAVRLEEGERTRFSLGDSTLFLVNQRERATAEARVKLIEIQAEYQQAVATYRVATVQF